MKRVLVSYNNSTIIECVKWCRANVGCYTKAHWYKIRKGSAKWCAEWHRSGGTTTIYFYFRNDKDAFRFAMECL